MSSGGSEADPLLRSEDEQTEVKQISSRMKKYFKLTIRLIVLLSSLLILPLVSTLLVVRDNNMERGDENCADFKLLSSEIFRLVLLFLALVLLSSLFCLYRLFSKKKLDNVRVSVEGKNWLLQGLSYWIPVLDKHASVPSTFLLAACILLGLFVVVGNGIKFIDGFIQLIHCSSHPSFSWILDKLLIPILQVAFTILQTIFFALYGNQSPNKFSILFFILMANLISTNLVSWLLSVNSEVFERFSNHSTSESSASEKLLPYIVPLTAEYSILCAIFGIFWAINIGHLVKLFSEHPVANEDDLQRLMSQNLHDRAVETGPDTVAQYWCGLGLGLIPLTAAIIYIFYFRSLNHMQQYILFYFVMMFLHIANAFPLIYCFRVGYQNPDSNVLRQNLNILGRLFLCRQPQNPADKQRLRRHAVDILLLFMTACTDIFVTNFFLLVYNFQSIIDPTQVNFNGAPANNSAPFVVALVDLLPFGIIDTFLQLEVLALTLAFDWTIHASSNIYWLKQCSVAMMLINLSEWLMFTFSSYVMIVDTDPIKDWTSSRRLGAKILYVLPYSILYRFHSVGCLDEIRRHLAKLELRQDNTTYIESVRLLDAADNNGGDIQEIPDLPGPSSTPT